MHTKYTVRCALRKDEHIEEAGVVYRESLHLEPISWRFDLNLGYSSKFIVKG